MSSVGERLEILYNHLVENKKAKSKADFCDIFKINKTNYSKYVNNKVKFTIDADNIEKFTQHNINIEWLLAGKGSILKQKAKTDERNKYSAALEVLKSLAKIDLVDLEIIDLLVSSKANTTQKKQLKEILKLTIDTIKSGGSIRLSSNDED